jgi:hypothetical protein
LVDFVNNNNHYAISADTATVSNNDERPKLVFDKSYTTTWVREQQWLTNHGIRYQWVGVINGITTFKYKKTMALFASLADFCKERNMYD